MARSSVLGLVNHTHATTAEHFPNAVMRNGLADHGWVSPDAPS
jgi:hypothetical protein